ncbi:peptidyl-tRNA hydrolase [Longispora fulva]|uniref:Peptidyl-tRNA hydrolase n=1 Tax=Longispora fulva TaxID=619741 RepID=A0A8J7GE77_9ACTN|nr:aminoacyl-tRNA hydrolase [Longispora fulva]MBG6138993.1 PTH1 family peptidyl-tRNA hydrolase [Longispora fulva]GIG58487.1 peptidyl-tRNA hydrolase [Longispora fulva]
MSDETFLVVGLGNPGKQYAGNRHNVGFQVADLLAERVGAKFGRHARAPKAEVAEGRVRPGGPKLVLVKPLTFMNLSGPPVAALAGFYKIPPERIIAVHDELDVPFTSLRIKIGGGEGGHNGLRSMSQSLGTKDYVRVRFGIGRPPGRQDAADFVLSDFSSVERKELPYFVDRTADIVEAVADNGVEWAQNTYHAA